MLSTYPAFMLNAFDNNGPCMFREITKCHNTQLQYHILIPYYFNTKHLAQVILKICLFGYDL